MKAKRSSLSYGDVGVDVGIEALGAKILYEAARKTWANRTGQLGEVISQKNDFSGLRFVRIDNLPKGTVMFGGSDGIATKAAIAEAVGRYDSLAFDLLAMVCDDAVIRGGEPVLVKSVLDVNTLGQDKSRLKHLEQLAKGYIAAAKAANVAVINGELAQLNDRAGDSAKFTLNWSGDVTWFAHESRLLTGFDVKAGDHLVGLSEPGVRCNGISLIRHVLQSKFGDKWFGRKLDGKTLGELALAPSLIYSAAVNDMTGGYNLKIKPKAKLHAAAHITGGGLPEKLGRALRPSGLGALIDNPFEPSPLFKYCQKLGNISDKEAYNTWNMGQGMVLITPDAQSVIEVAESHKIKAKIIGKVTKKSGISIVSQGHKTPNKLLAW